MIVCLDERGRTRFSCRILDLCYICVFFAFGFCAVVLLYPGVVFRARACVGLWKFLFFRALSAYKTARPNFSTANSIFRISTTEMFPHKSAAIRNIGVLKQMLCDHVHTIHFSLTVTSSQQNYWIGLSSRSAVTHNVTKRRRIRGGLRSLWLYKENKIRD
jgi:hypothetical protein